MILNNEDTSAGTKNGEGEAERKFDEPRRLRATYTAREPEYPRSDTLTKVDTLAPAICMTRRAESSKRQVVLRVPSGVSLWSQVCEEAPYLIRGCCDLGSLNDTDHLK